MGEQPSAGRERKLYFVGTGKAADLRSAESASLNDAKNKAKQHIGGILTMSQQNRTAQPDRRIIDSILDVSERSNKFFQVSKGPHTSYTYYTLLKIDMELAKLNIKILPTRSTVTVPEKFVDNLQMKMK